MTVGCGDPDCLTTNLWSIFSWDKARSEALDHEGQGWRQSLDAGAEGGQTNAVRSAFDMNPKEVVQTTRVTSY